MSIIKITPSSYKTQTRSRPSLYLACGLILTALILAGCSGFVKQADRSEAAPAAEAEAPAEYRDDDTGSVTLAEPPAEAPAGGSAVEVAGAAKEEAARADYGAVEERSLAVEAEGEAMAPAGTAVSEIAEVEADMLVEAEEAPPADAVEIQQAQSLRAGEVDDNAHWDDYLLYRRNYQGPPVHERNVTERYVIEVQDGQHNPLLGATVRIFLPQQGQEIFTAHTYANGRILFQPLALDIPEQQADRFLVEVQYGNLLEQFTLTRFNAQTSSSFSERWTATLDTQQGLDSMNLDVLFLIDATGSMADEIAKVQSTIFDVAARIDALPGRPDVRYGMVTYRDRDDSFVSNTYEFTPDVSEFHRDLSTVYADGGGDYPESLNEGLHNALGGVEWRGADALKLIFLIADAPPHLDYAQDYDYAVEMENAARRGIKIFPIASSGLDDQGEYIFRQLAQYTQGRFIFLTYAGPTNGGAPGDVTTHHVDDFSVENLDDLLVRLVEEELAYQNPRLAQFGQ